MATVDALEAQINDLAKQRQQLTDQLAKCRDFTRRGELSDQIQQLGEQALALEAERRQLLAGQSAAARPTRTPIDSKGATMPEPNFELYERARGNSVHSEPGPAVSLTTTQLTLNAQALTAIGVKVGDSLSVYVARDAGMLAIKKPPKGWSTNKSSKLSAVKASGAGVLNSLATFLRWAGIKPKPAKGIYQLTYDELHDHWWFQLPSGAWTKPTAGTPASGVSAGSATRGNGTTSAAKRADLPGTSPYRATG